MNKRTLTALQESIEKWRQIERGEMMDLGCENCSLCNEFHHDESGQLLKCRGCPVKARTGQTYCDDTPYPSWLETNRTLNKNWSAGEYVADTPELVRLARAERKFLESLLPKAKR